MGQYQEALNMFKKTIQIDATSSSYLGLGDALYQLNSYEEALSSYKKSITLDPNNYHAHYHEGDALVKLARYEDASLAYKQLIEIIKQKTFFYAGYELEHVYNIESVHCKLGDVFYELKRFEEALAAYNEVWYHNATSLYRKGCILLSFKNYKEALIAFKASINLDCNNANAWRKKGDTLKLLNRLDASHIHLLYELRKYKKVNDGHVASNPTIGIQIQRRL